MTYVREQSPAELAAQRQRGASGARDVPEAVLPTLDMVIDGFEAVTHFQESDAYKAMSGCQGAAESARVCWAAMVAAMPEGAQPRQGVMPTNEAILAAWQQVLWPTGSWHVPDEVVVRFVRMLLARYGNSGGGTETAAARDVLAERHRQVHIEGWTTERDDFYDRAQLAQAGAAYALAATGRDLDAGAVWPWAGAWWRPTTPRRNLVKACALILAEIERLDRAAEQHPTVEGEK